MNKAKRERQKRNRKRKKMQFFNNKASFVAAITVFMMLINDSMSFFSKVPLWLNLTEIVIVSLLYVFALCTKKMDRFLSTERVENFSAFLTFCSIVAFVLMRGFAIYAEGESPTSKLSSDGVLLALAIIIIFAVIIGGALFLFFYKGKGE